MSAVMSKSCLWVAPENTAHALSNAASLLLPAIEYSDGRYTLESLEQLLTENKAMLWLVTEGPEFTAAGISWIDETPSGKKLVLGFAGGDKHDLYQLKEHVELYAKQMDCTSCEVWGRRGWLRELKDYTHLFTVLKKDL